MRKLIAILFIAALSATLLPGVLSWDQKSVTLFSTVEEEQPEKGKAPENDDVKESHPHDIHLLAQSIAQRSYSNLFLLFTQDPFIGNQTPPPDSFC